MREFRNESLIPDVIDEADAMIPRSFPQLSRHTVTDDHQQYYVRVLQQTVMALDTLMLYLAGRPRDSHFVDQLRDYIRRLLGVTMAHTPEEQFQHLYAFRKWLLWVPLGSMRSSEKDYTTLVILAYLYSIALQMDALYPNVAPVFCSSMAERPLKQIFREFEKLEIQQQSYGGQQLEVQLELLSFPRQVANNYFAQRQQAAGLGIQMPQPSQHSFEGYRQDLASNMGIPLMSGHDSPGFQSFDQLRRRMSQASVSSSKESPLPEGPKVLHSEPLPAAIERTPQVGYRHVSTGMSHMPLAPEALQDLGVFGQENLQYTSGFVASPSKVTTCST